MTFEHENRARGRGVESLVGVFALAYEVILAEISLFLKPGGIDFIPNNEMSIKVIPILFKVIPVFFWGGVIMGITLPLMVECLC